MGNLPMRKDMPWRATAPKSSAFAVVVVAIAIISLAMLSYTVYANHSTISSLKSELSKKDQMLGEQDNLIQEKEAIINQSEQDIQQKQEEVQKKSEEIQTLQQQVSLKVERLKAEKEQQERLAQFEDGWKATYYSLGIESTGKRPGQPGYGITASGRAVSDVTIAVDPRYIPLGTWVEIQLPDGSIVRKRADDTGSAIKGKIIDIYMGDKTRQQLMELGKDNIKIRILKGVAEL